MSWTRTTAVWLATLALSASACVEVVVVRPDSGTVDGGGDSDAGAGEDGGGQDGDGGGGTEAGSTDGGSPDDIVTGSPEGEWRNVTNNLAKLPAQCGMVTTIAASPWENRLMVGISANGIYSSTNGGESWSPMGTGAGSVDIGSRVSQFLFDPEYEDTFYLAGIYAEPGVVKTTDNGTTFKALGDVWHNDSVSVDFSDPERKTLLAGTHEQTRTLWRSADSGATWQNIGGVLPGDAGWSLFPLVIDAQTYLLGTPGAGIYRSANAGTAWSKVSSLGGGAPPLRASDDSLYWPSAEEAGMVRSTDDGETWEQVTPAGIVYGVTPIELPDGRIATRGPMGVLVSPDQGAHWELVAPPQPFDDPFHNLALAYSIDERAFFVAQGACASSVAEDAVARFDWDYEQ